MDEKHLTIQDVVCSELKENMVILSYTGFDNKYKQLDQNTCQWFRVNFEGCRFTVKRSGKVLATTANRIEVGDELVEIGKLPESLKKISIVSEPLKKELAHRGFLKFKVALPRQKSTGKADNIRIDTENAIKLVEKVAENLKFREEAAEAVEYFLDNARKGIIQKKEIQGFVDELIDKSSSDALMAIANLKKSDQTYGHCVDVSAIYSSVYQKIVLQNRVKSAFKNDKELAFASFVHDFGKAKIPKDILESRVRFELNSPEMELMRTHPQYGMELVQKMTHSENTINMVLLHHLKLDNTINSSYPKNVEGIEVLWETRLLSIVDSYQALVGRRSYKKSWSPASAIRYLDALAGIEYDMTVWDDFYNIMGQFPVSSLVELSDGSLAFVIKVHQDDPANPQVVVVQDTQENTVEKHEIFDLCDEPDINIVKDIDAQDFFGDQAFEAFSGICLS